MARRRTPTAFRTSTLPVPRTWSSEVQPQLLSPPQHNPTTQTAGTYPPSPLLPSPSRVPVYIRDASRRSGRFVVGTLIVKNLISVDAEAGVRGAAPLDGRAFNGIEGNGCVFKLAGQGEGWGGRGSVSISTDSGPTLCGAAADGSCPDAEGRVGRL